MDSFNIMTDKRAPDDRSQRPRQKKLSALEKRQRKMADILGHFQDGLDILDALRRDVEMVSESRYLRGGQKENVMRVSTSLNEGYHTIKYWMEALREENLDWKGAGNGSDNAQAVR